MTERETDDQTGRLSSKLRLIPLTSVMPILAARPPARPTELQRRAPEPTVSARDLRRAAESLVELCAQVLRGRHPLSAIRRVADPRAFAQFTTLFRRTRPLRPNAEPVSLRLSHTATDPSGVLTMVALMRAGDRVRAVSLCARPRSPRGWQLTLCQLIENR